MRQCSVESCQEKHYANDWCNKHYQRWLKHGDVNYTKIARIRGGQKHPLNGLPEWAIWKDIKRRTCDRKHHAYPNYGGRGITMSDEWLNSAVAFYEDMGPKPTSKHSIERQDNDGPYCKENCIWADRTAQSNNRRNNIRIEYLGRTQTLAQWCTELHLEYEIIRGRYHRGGTPPRLFRPIRSIRTV